jgi:protein required for attachment to host cells
MSDLPIWIVVADAGRARIFSAPPMSGSLDERVDLLNPQVRLEDHQALSDRRGHVTQEPGGIGHAFKPRETFHEHITEAFAKDVCHLLDSAQREHRLRRLYLIAAPRFLGLLRKNLDPETRKLIILEHPADLSRHDVTEIRNALPLRL